MIVGAERLAQRDRGRARRRRHAAHDRELRLLREQRRHRALSRAARRRRADPALLSALRRGGPRVRAVAHQPGRGPAQPAAIPTSAARSSTIWPPRSPTRRTCSGRAPWTRPTPSVAPSCFDKYRQGKSTVSEQAPATRRVQVKGAQVTEVDDEQAGLIPPPRMTAKTAASWCPPADAPTRCRRTSRRGRSRASRSRRSARTRRRPRWCRRPRATAGSPSRHVSVHMGGATAAVAHYHESPTPNLIIIETSLPRGADAGRARPARAVLRRRHQGGGDRPHQRRRALP